MTAAPTVLYLSHTGMSEPLGESQVLPYVKGLARSGWPIEIICFEPHSAEAPRLEEIRSELSSLGIGYRWARRSSSHSVRVKAAEALWALRQMLSPTLHRSVRLIHARSYLPAAIAGLFRSVAPRAKMLFDCRGLLGDEYVDAGHWSSSSPQYRATKRAESWLFHRADAIVVLTNRMREWVRPRAAQGVTGGLVEVIPCCVDMSRFRFDESSRHASRRALGAGDRKVIAYSGSLGSWYAERELVELFDRLRARVPALLLILTQSASGRLESLLQGRGIARDDFRVVHVAPRDMPSMLSAADAGVSFIRPSFSKMASSPTKIAEYLAMGLPTFLNRGVGDCDELLSFPGMIDAGALDDESLRRAADQFAALSWGATERAACRSLAQTRFSLDEVGIPRYQRLYQALVN